MLHPLQLKEVSVRHAVEVAELRDFLGKAGIPVETPEAIGSVAARLSQARREQEGAFRRDLTLHLWAIFHAPGQQVAYSNVMAMLAVAAAGPTFAVEAAAGDTQELLRFVMEASSGFDTRHEATRMPPTPMPVAVAPALPLVQPPRSAGRVPGLQFEAAAGSEEDVLPSFSMEEEEDGRPPLLLWGGIAVCAILMLCFGFWLHGRASAVSPAAAAIPAASANSEAAQPTIAPVETPNASHRAHSAATAAQPSRTSQGRTNTTVLKAPSPQTTAPSFSAAAAIASRAPAVESPRSVGPANGPATKAPAAAAHPVSPTATRSNRTPQPVATANRSASSPDEPLVTLYTPIVHPETIGTMASNLTYGPAAEYPAAAIDQQVQGQVRLEAKVDRKGNVVSARVVSGPPLLQEAAVNAVQSWQYRPFLYDGKPITMNATVVMDFQLR